MIDYQNITDNEIKRIVACAADPAAQVLILRDLTGKSIAYIKRAAGMILTAEDKLREEKEKKWGWSEADIQYLRDNPEMTIRELAAALGKTADMTWKMKAKLGITKMPRWNDKTTNELIRLYRSGVKPRTISKLLERSYGSVTGKLGQLKEKGIIS